MSGPCIYCGATNFSPSIGGPMICASCDCGNFGPQVVQRQGETITTLRAEIANLRSKLKAIIKANDDFRAGMPDGWEGDPLQDACDDARMFADVTLTS